MTGELAPQRHVLMLTEATMGTALKLCRTLVPSEACGFVVASGDDVRLGVRIQFMRNVHPNPLRHYRMDNDVVVSTMAEFDKAGEEPVAVFHSHVGPGAQPVMSPEDVEGAVDESIIHMVIAIGTGRKASVRAYRVRRFIGAASIEEVEIRVVEEPQPMSAISPMAFAVVDIAAMREEIRRDINLARLNGGEKDWRDGHPALAQFYDRSKPKPS